MSIRETPLNLTALEVMNKDVKGAVMHISTVLWPVYHVA